MKSRSEIMKAAWGYRKAGKTWSESLKAAWAYDSLDFASLTMGKAESAPRKPLVLDLRYSGDLGKLRGMVARELATGTAYSFSVA